MATAEGGDSGGGGQAQPLCHEDRAAVSEEGATAPLEAASRQPRSQPTILLIEERREEVLGTKSTCCFIFSQLCQAAFAYACWYLGSHVPLNKHCESPWKVWYRIQALLTCLRLLAMLAFHHNCRNVLMNDDFVKSAIYAEQGRQQESEEAVVAAANSGAVIFLASMTVHGCSLMMLTVVDTAWKIYAGYLYLSENDSCESETKYLAYLLLASVFLVCLPGVGGGSKREEADAEAPSLSRAEE
eukprot:TRINITY_DN42609_c0_g1_i1.p1 TRINITY_DN42609_c0_g1~~TRINITY_DN42609_c0_g1_i1.p1  ORF type:complete len:243 (-),score=29.95 TRINITY_DN42609_c0_g1_i1:86-814(-)